MSYNFLTQYNSPNFTPANEAQADYGRPRTIEKIAIHWWGDPNTNPTFSGVAAHLCNPAAQVSAHFVATGTNRQVACLVNTSNIAWATVSANPYTIAIECDPRCRDEDYDVVGELVAELRATFGNLPLMRHSDVYATTCPGNYSLDRINAVAATKIAKASDQYGMAVTKTVAPTITEDEIRKLYLDILERPVDADGLAHYLKSGMNAGGVRDDLLNSAEYKALQVKKTAQQKAAADAAAKAEADKKTQEDVKAQAEADARSGYTQADRDRDNKIAGLIQWLVDKIKSIFK